MVFSRSVAVRCAVKLDHLASDDQRETPLQTRRAACGRRRVFGCVRACVCGLDALLCSSVLLSYQIQIRCASSKEQGFAAVLRLVLATELEMVYG